MVSSQLGVFVSPLLTAHSPTSEEKRFTFAFFYLTRRGLGSLHQDPWNSIMSGAAAGAVMAARQGPKSMVKFLMEKLS